MEQTDGTFIKKTYSSEEKQTLIEGWKQSGKSRMAFSKEHGINYHTLISWVAPKKKKQQVKVKSDRIPPTFSEVKMPALNGSTVFARISIGKSSG
ncbi:MAG: transposase [Bacteroidetes bacterium]|nr:transposase [Bacteroidota bacterium]